MRIWFLLAVLATGSQAQTVDPDLYANMKWRQIGPFRGGRSVACSGVYGKPKEFYMGTCGGGLWKSEDAGENWACVTDGFLRFGSVGAVEVSRSSPDTVFLGTGERDIRGNISEGNGVYKSTNGGKSWQHVGLTGTKTVSRIVVHPTNPDVVWVAALGHVYGANSERGVFKSTDGGTTWRKVLYESDRAGAADICIDTKNPSILYASTWEAWRTPYSLNSGGPGSKLWKSTDGGEHWQDISRNPGMPSGVLGKIGVSVSPADSNRVYALVENANGGLFSSDDAGASWKQVNADHEFTQRAWYYMRVVADPGAKDTVYVLNTGLFRSKNGGKSLTGLSSQHGDEHDLWIDPADPKRMINSDDGGSCVTVDGGQTWSQEDFPTAQFYHVSTDNAVPYRILGAQQDNSTVRIASRAGGRGITSADWTSTAGGESGYVVADPGDPDVVFGGSYGGDLSMLNHRTGESRAVDPWPNNPMGHGAIDSKFRFQWTYPILFSPHNRQVLYTCSQHVHRTTNGGESWQVISPDLTRNDPKTLQSSGGPITQDNTSVEYYGTVFTLAESPKKRGVLWAGSDDGLVHVSLNDGKAWTDVTPKGMPKWGLCSMIDASPHVANRAFLAVDNHENDDDAPYVYRTDDFGKSWKAVTSGLPSDAFVRVVREDPAAPNLLYCGTERGAFVSFNGGSSWQPLQMNLPYSPIHDLTIKNDDLIVATHGRSFWVLDNLTSLRQMSNATASEAALFVPKPFARGSQQRGFRGRAGTGSTEPVGDNPPSGIVFDYYLPSAAKAVSVVVKDKQGIAIGSASSLAGDKGFHRATLGGLRYPGYRSFPGMVFWAGRGGSIPAPPGDYDLTLTVDGVEKKQVLTLKRNPSGAASEADLIEQFRFARQIVERVNQANDAVVIIRDLRKKLDAAAKALPSVADSCATIAARVTRVEQTIYQTKSQSGQDPLNYPILINDKLAGVLGNVLSGDFRPTRQSYEVFEQLSKQLEPLLIDLNEALRKELTQINAKLKAAGLEEVVPVDPARTGGG